MIRGFADKERSLVWSGIGSRRLPSDIQEIARRKLRQLNRIVIPTELRIPSGNRFEALKGNRKGAYSIRINDYSIRINDQWRITFRWLDGAADDVRIEDCHR